MIVPEVPYLPDETTNALGENGFTKKVIFSESAAPYIEVEIISLFAQKMGIPAMILLLNQRLRIAPKTYFTQ